MMKKKAEEAELDGQQNTKRQQQQEKQQQLSDKRRQRARNLFVEQTQSQTRTQLQRLAKGQSQRASDKR